MTMRLAVPVEPDEYTDLCHFSPSHYAIWKRHPSGEKFRDWCTCRPARKPKRANGEHEDRK